jgi:hypothetical protein
MLWVWIAGAFCAGSLFGAVGAAAAMCVLAGRALPRL